MYRYTMLDLSFFDVNMSVFKEFESVCSRLRKRQHFFVTLSLGVANKTGVSVRSSRLLECFSKSFFAVSFASTSQKNTTEYFFLKYFLSAIN